MKEEKEEKEENKERRSRQRTRSFDGLDLAPSLFRGYGSSRHSSFSGWSKVGMARKNDPRYVLTKQLRRLLIALPRSFFCQDLGPNRKSQLLPFDINEFLDQEQGHREMWRGRGSPRPLKGFEPFIEVLDGLIKELKQRPPIAARLYALQHMLYQEMEVRGEMAKLSSYSRSLGEWLFGMKKDSKREKMHAMITHWAHAAVVSYFYVSERLVKILATDEAESNEMKIVDRVEPAALPESKQLGATPTNTPHLPALCEYPFDPAVMRLLLDKKNSIESRLLKKINNCIGGAKTIHDDVSLLTGEYLSLLRKIKSSLQKIETTLPISCMGVKTRDLRAGSASQYCRKLWSDLQKKQFWSKDDLRKVQEALINLIALNVKDYPKVVNCPDIDPCYKACDDALKGEKGSLFLIDSLQELSQFRDSPAEFLSDGLQELSSFFDTTGGASVKFDVSSCRKVIERIKRSVGVIEGSLNPTIPNSNTHQWLIHITQMIKDVKVFLSLEDVYRLEMQRHVRRLAQAPDDPDNYAMRSILGLSKQCEAYIQGKVQRLLTCLREVCPAERDEDKAGIKNLQSKLAPYKSAGRGVYSSSSGFDLDHRVRELRALLIEGGKIKCVANIKHYSNFIETLFDVIERCRQDIYQEGINYLLPDRESVLYNLGELRKRLVLIEKVSKKEMYEQTVMATASMGEISSILANGARLGVFELPKPKPKPKPKPQPSQMVRGI